MKSEPLRLLGRSVRNQVLVKLKDGHEYLGTLERFDSCMNLILRDAVEAINGTTTVARYGKILVRGNNILYIKTGEP